MEIPKNIYDVLNGMVDPSFFLGSITIGLLLWKRTLA
jgi:hypothetical protein